MNFFPYYPLQDNVKIMDFILVYIILKTIGYEVKGGQYINDLSLTERHNKKIRRSLIGLVDNGKINYPRPRRG